MAQEINPTQFLFVKWDVTFRNQVKDAIFQAYETFGRIDAIINWVGIFDVDPIVIRASINKFYAVPQGFFANVLGSVYTAKYFTQLKGNGEGVVLNVCPMINNEEIRKYTKYFNQWVDISSYTVTMAEILIKKGIRFVSISPSTMDTLMPDSSIISQDDIRRALIIDSVIKRYENYKEFVDMAIYSLTNSEINGVELELGSEDSYRPPMIARI